MGLMLGIFSLIFQGMGIFSTMQNSAEQQKAVLDEETIRMDERVKRARRLAGQQKASFASSGIVLGESSPLSMVLLNDTYDIAKQDISTMGRNYQTKLKTIQSAERASMLKGFASMAMTGMSMANGMTAPNNDTNPFSVKLDESGGIGDFTGADTSGFAKLDFSSLAAP